eukprot:CAMPEP_0203878400 /NCGR_PEP_ID=MMETSP0359-20131031/22941_1 /ASSEMBLY_ACC=CAM_ASM_000338 /TAXON_ID=268821 /ORGANISM="Scrippsiella Hangoei, Strain SHTV-5" /LENGTH=150 /DNA_ID=CAMNT_0050797561 /DNA_START=34 /DNA_END=486 /DNA_ORIENTATION=+
MRFPLTLPTSVRPSISKTSSPSCWQINGDAPSHSKVWSLGNCDNAKALQAYICGDKWFSATRYLGMLFAMKPARICKTAQKALIMLTEKPECITMEFNMMPMDSPLKRLAIKTTTKVSCGPASPRRPVAWTMVNPAMVAVAHSSTSSTNE